MLFINTEQLLSGWNLWLNYVESISRVEIHYFQWGSGVMIWALLRDLDDNLNMMFQ